MGEEIPASVPIISWFGEEALLRKLQPPDNWQLTLPWSLFSITKKKEVKLRVKWDGKLGRSLSMQWKLPRWAEKWQIASHHWVIFKTLAFNLQQCRLQVNERPTITEPDLFPHLFFAKAIGSSGNSQQVPLCTSVFFLLAPGFKGIWSGWFVMSLT